MRGFFGKLFFIVNFLGANACEVHAVSAVVEACFDLHFHTVKTHNVLLFCGHLLGVCTVLNETGKVQEVLEYKGL